MHQIDDSARRRELGDFLRSRRERISPAAAGLRATSRRRTPGLRREEVAELAGIGTAWYTWLEQARDIRPSEGAMRQIARALQLNDTERRYLYDLALERVPIRRSEEIVTPALHAILSTFQGPAYVKGRRWDLLAYNELACALFDYDNIPDRNLLRSMFRPESRRLLPNWEPIARQHVAIFRTENAGALKDPWILQLVEELRATSPEFSRWWSEQAVSEMQSGHKTYDHPFAGSLRLDFSVLVPCDAPHLRLVVYVPGDHATRVSLATLLARRQRGERFPMWDAPAPSATL
jgi:transcriptional regulator with XRE-family HTH domain